MEAERNLAIERENKILLGKMYSIMNAEPAYKTHKVTVTSLNLTVRKQEYDRIARENQAIMQRILQREPDFNRAKLDEDWKETQRYLRNISEYPFILGHLPPATRKKTLKPLKLGGAMEEDISVNLDLNISGEEVVAATTVTSAAEEEAKAAAAAEAERLEREKAEAAAAAEAAAETERLAAEEAAVAAAAAAEGETAAAPAEEAPAEGEAAAEEPAAEEPAAE